MNISIIIPCYNEEKRIKKTFKKIKSWYKSQNKIKIDLILIDDGSYDSTYKVIKEISETNRFVTAIKRNHFGYINTLFYGFAKCKYKIVGNMEADNAIDVSYFSKFCKYIDDFDVVTADRVSGNFLKKNINKTFFRKVLSIFYLIFFKILFNSKINDAQAGFRLYKKKILLKFINQIKIKHDGLKIAELILRLEKKNFKIKQLAVINYHDNDSRLVPNFEFKNLHVIFVLIIEMIINLIKLKIIIK